MDFLNQFQTIKLNWLRKAGMLSGQDILNDKFKIHFYTILVLCVDDSSLRR